MSESLEHIDQQSRQRILCDLDSNLMVEAAAGTGKTTSIVGRMVNLIATAKCDIGEIAAMTFTRKAAAELRERFHLELRSQSVNEDRDEEQRGRLSDAVSRAESAFVGTIHSFCTLLLRERPIEMNVSPNFRELEQPENELLIDQAWNAFLDQLYESKDSLLASFDDFGIQASELRFSFGRFVSNPDVDSWPHTNVESDDFDWDGLKQTLHEYLQHIDAIRVDFEADRKNDKLMNRLEAILRKSNHIHWNRVCDVFDLVALFDTSHGCVQKDWHDKAYAKRERDRFVEFRERVAGPARQWWFAYRYGFVIRVFQQAAKLFEACRRESGGLNFEDLLQKSAFALQQQPKLRRYFQRRFSHLLLDEFQDTDPLQAKIISFLTSSDPEQQTWHQCDPVPGSLFLVGDPKQSIFRFRRADIVTYSQMKNVFARSGDVISLSKNFRSVAAVREWNNDVYGALFPRESNRHAPASNDMLQGRAETDPGDLIGIRQLTLPGDLKTHALYEYEAETIAHYIHHAIKHRCAVSRTQEELDRGASPAAHPGDFLIVAWKKEHLQYYSDALDRYGISNEVTGSNAFQAIEELQILTTCLKAVDDVTNPLPYVGLLRGPVFGFSDEDLYRYKSAGGRFSYRSLPEGLDLILHTKFQYVHERLQKYSGWLRSLPFVSAVERIATDLGLVARSAVPENGNVNAGGFLKAIEWLRAQSWNFDSTQDMIGYLEQLCENAESDPMVAMHMGQSAVRVMNLHKVKGLEAPVVFLAGVTGQYEHPPSFHIDRSGTKNDGYFAVSKEERKYRRSVRLPIAQHCDWERISDEALAFDRAEKKRLLYVATTRAKTQLVVSRRAKNSQSRWQDLDPFLDNADELSVPLVDETPIVSSQPTATVESSETIALRWDRMLEPSYKILAAKKMSLRGVTRPKWQASGDYGHQWGTVIHELLESRMRDPTLSLPEVAALLAEEYQIEHCRVAELVETVDRVLASSIWRRAQAASQRFVELPFDVPAGFDDQTAIIRGVIDLLFEEPHGWVIVDYKTDDISAADINEAINYYRPQLQSYVSAWQGATNTKIVETGLYFTRIDEYHRV